MLQRPRPPAHLVEKLRHPAGFEPAPELEHWARETFTAAGAQLENSEHRHLRLARVGFLWTNVANSRGGSGIVGTAEIPSVKGGKWLRGRLEYQLCEWFGDVPDFLVTLDAVYARQVDDAGFCSLVEHELYHCGQARDKYGCPKFRKDGSPVFSMRPHDVEEFVGVVRRYGIAAAAGRTADLVLAANLPPSIAPAQIAAACGACLRIAA